MALDTIHLQQNTDSQNAALKVALESLRTQGKIDSVTYKKIKEQLENLEGLGLSIQQETVELGKLKNTYETKRIDHNKKEIDRQLKEKEKELLATRQALEEAKKKTGKETEKPKYGDKGRKHLVDEATKENKGKKIDKEIMPTIRRMNPFLKYMMLIGGTGGMFMAGTGIERDSKGKLTYDFNKLIETAIAPLPDVQEQWAKRFLVKQGIYKIEQAELEYKENPNALKQDVIEVISDKNDPPELRELKEKVARLEYFKQLTYTQKLAEVIDYKATSNMPKGEVAKLWSYRNQYVNEKGFGYIPTPNNGNTGKAEKSFYNVQGIAHFLLDCDATEGQIPMVGDIDNAPDHYVHANNTAFFRIAKERNDYIPVFTREGDRIRVHYKRGDEIKEGDRMLSPLRQFKFDDISFSETRTVMTSARELLLKKGIKNPYRNDNDQRGTYLIYSGNPTTYSQFSGSSVVFIFEDNQGNRIIRDFAGSINDIQKEGSAIKAEFNLTNGALTIGIHDIGSFSAKPVANNHVYTTKQSERMNWNVYTGGGLAIPDSQY